MGKHKLTLAVIVWAVFMVFILWLELTGQAAEVPATPQTPQEGYTGTQEPEKAVTGQETSEETAEDALMEDEMIEAALLEQGYYREDVPLTYLEQDFLHTACAEAGIPYELALAVIEQETQFRNVMGDDGDSIGYMQIQPRWHAARMERLGVTDLTDPYSNFRVGCDFLAELMDSYYSVEAALVAYNQGHYNGYTTEYAKSVINNMEKWRNSNAE